MRKEIVPPARNKGTSYPQSSSSSQSSALSSVESCQELKVQLYEGDRPGRDRRPEEAAGDGQAHREDPAH